MESTQIIMQPEGHVTARFSKEDWERLNAMASYGASAIMGDTMAEDDEVNRLLNQMKNPEGEAQQTDVFEIEDWEVRVIAQLLRMGYKEIGEFTRESDGMLTLIANSGNDAIGAHYLIERGGPKLLARL